MDVTTVVEVAIALLIGVMLYKQVMSFKKPKLQKDVAAHRSAPVVITRNGIVRMVRKELRGPNDYQAYFDDGSNQHYTHGDGYDDLIPVDNHQFILGNNAPLLIERAIAMEIAYGREHHVWREQLKAKLNLTLEKMAERSATAKDIHQARSIIESLQETPLVGRDLVEAHQRQSNRAGRFQSELSSLEAGQQGRISRAIEPIIDIAAKGAGRKESARERSSE